jgi:hypothetical protein
MDDHNTNMKTTNNWQSSQYTVNWDSNTYLQDHYLVENIEHTRRFFLVNVIEILDKHSEKLQGKQRVLEFGGGPCLWPSFLLAQYFDEIWFCDYTPSNLQCVQDWLDEKPNAFDWKPYFNFMLDIKKGHHHDKDEYEARLRSALRKGKIFRCDIHDSNLLFLDECERNQQFDMIFTCACLEAACLTHDMFKQTIHRLGNLLKPDGILLLLTYRNSSFYVLNGQTFTNLRQYFTATYRLINIRQRMSR